MLVMSILTQTSKWLEHQVVEQVQHHVSVEQHAPFTLDRRCVSIYQACDLLERTVNGYEDKQYLPLPCLDLAFVEVASLEVCKPQLCRCCLVRIGRTQHHFHSEELNASPCLIRSVVRGTVEKHHDSFSPADSVLLRECCSKLRQKHLHHVLVRVALSQ